MRLFDRIRVHARATPDRTAIEWAEGTVGYGALAAEVARLAGFLRQHTRGALAVDMDNGPAWAMLDLAALAAEVTIVPLPLFFSSGQVRHALTHAGVGAVCTDDPDRLRARAGHILPGEPAATVEIAGKTLSWVPASTGDESVAPGVAKVTYTSGTTGEPKGVMLRWEPMERVVRSLVDAVAVTPADRHLALMPLAVLLENIAGLYAPLWAGGTAVIPSLEDVGVSGSSGLDPGKLTGALHRFRASTAIFTPHTLQALVEAVEQGDRKPESLRFAAVGGAPVSGRLLERAVRLGIPVFEGYGLSESASVACLNTPGSWRAGSVGRPLPHLSVRVAADGEVQVFGGGFAGYLGQEPPATGWWGTGDLGHLDGDGFLYLTGRRRNMFITAAGRNVAPEWVERELTCDRAIAQAAVFGEARPWNAAVIVPAPGASAAAVAGAVRSANRGLPDYARVTRWLPAGEPFTAANGLLTGTGRVRRGAVWARYRDHIESIYLEESTV